MSNIIIIAASFLVGTLSALPASAASSARRPTLEAAPGARSTSGYRDMLSRLTVVTREQRPASLDAAGGYRDMLARFSTGAPAQSRRVACK